MKKIILFLFTLCQLQIAYCQLPYWQQEVNYSIDVSLNDTAHTLDGFERIEYVNNSPDTLKFIWFHIWANAFKNDQTAFSDQLLELGNTDFYFSDKDQKGYINRLDFRVNERRAETEDHPEHIDIIKVILPEPLAPRQKATITTPFHIQLPFNYSRGGHDGQSYQATQWYPKPAVYDKKGWHPMPYLDQGEFYSEFGKFEVTIDVPKNYVVAATGQMNNAGEVAWLKSRKDYDWKPEKIKKQTPAGVVTITEKFPPSDKERKSVSFTQNNVHDFAWFADKRYIVNMDSCKLPTGKIVTVITYYTPASKQTWSSSVQYAKDALLHYSSWVGEYPYNIVQVVEGPESFGGGMEYPTITVISPVDNEKDLDHIIAHEIGHNWFYGALATNERDHPWMDEGLNSFYDHKYRVSKWGEAPKLEQIGFETKAITKTDQPINLHSNAYTEINYGLSVYYKTAEWLRYLESKLGANILAQAIKDYYAQWKFKHPQPEDFKNSLETSTRQILDEEFALLNKTGTLPNQKRTGAKTIFILNIPSLTNYVKQPAKEMILYGPAIGANSYDKLMVGAFITNLKLPPSPFQFFVAPMYATGSSKLKGIGFAGYSFYPDGLFRQVDIGITGSFFTANKFTDENGNKTYLGFRKLVPGIKLFFNNNNPKSSVTRFIQFKSYIISEDRLRFSRDTVIIGGVPTPVTTYKVAELRRSLHQLRFVHENNRALYPHNGELRFESSEDFLRSSFTGNYFFNYPKGGGLNVRLFAGKFFYIGDRTSSKQFATDRFHLNLSGPNGFEDYTYSDYFIGRNHFEEWQSQQMMIRDGAFKVRTELLATKVGKTDDWLAAVNLTSNIPSAINPFELLPVRLPVKLFFDIGTYAEAWKQDAETDRFLFDAGLYLPLLKETINIYIPLFYSSVFSEYYESTFAKKQRFWKKISFTIDLSNFSFRKIDRNFSF